MNLYHLIGGDGQEYGPVDLSTLKTWIREGRADARTLIRYENSTEWKQLADFAELALELRFTPTAAPPAAEAYQPPATPAAMPAWNDAQSSYQPQRVNIFDGGGIRIGSCFSRSWELFKSRPAELLIAAAIFIGLLLLLEIPGWLGGRLMSRAEQGDIDAVFNPAFWLGYTTQMLGVFFYMLVGGVISGGMFSYVLRLLRGEPAELANIFDGFRVQTAQLVLGGLVAGLLTSIGFLLCIVPGVYLAVAWMFHLPLIIDKRMGFWQAMEWSRQMVTPIWLSAFLLLLLGMVLSMVGLMLCLVGILVALPILLGAVCYAYEDLFRDRPVPSL